MRSLSTVLIAAALASSSFASALTDQRSDAAVVRDGTTPASRVAAFYRWYVGLMAADLLPSDQPAKYASLVTASLRKRIRAEMDANSLDADYFIKAQDYEDAWAKRIETQALMTTARNSHVKVTLGAGTTTAKSFDVTLVMENGRWKIEDVKAVLKR